MRGKSVAQTLRKKGERPMTGETTNDDVFYGVPAIAEAIKFKPRQVNHLKTITACQRSRSAATCVLAAAR